MTEEGHIQFRCEHSRGPIVEKHDIEDLLAVREKLFEAGLIGQDAKGVAYGNISKRVIGSGRFYITGTQTGGFARLYPEHITLVLAADLRTNEVRCSGAVKASSESLTHWAIYEADENINAVIHVHHESLWRYLINAGLPTTDHSIPYGTPQMGEEVQRLYVEGDARESKLIVMGGHESGLLSYGGSLAEAFSVLMTWYGRADR